jgi:hypothetical protein
MLVTRLASSAMSAPALSNVRLITILAASLLAGYAGDEAYNVWWQDGGGLGEDAASAQLAVPPSDSQPPKVALARQSIRGN